MNPAGKWICLCACLRERDLPGVYNGSVNTSIDIIRNQEEIELIA